MIAALGVLTLGCGRRRIFLLVSLTAKSETKSAYSPVIKERRKPRDLYFLLRFELPPGPVVPANHESSELVYINL